MISELSGEMTMEAYSKGEKGIELLAMRSIDEVDEGTDSSIQELRKNRSSKCPPINDNDKEIPYEEMSWVIVSMIMTFGVFLPSSDVYSDLNFDARLFIGGYYHNEWCEVNTIKTGNILNSGVQFFFENHSQNITNCRQTTRT